MCGLCGALSFDDRPCDREVAARMVNSLRHRGPDDQRTYWGRAEWGAVFLSYTRLSMDLSEAHCQPLCNETGRV